MKSDISDCPFVQLETPRSREKTNAILRRKGNDMRRVGHMMDAKKAQMRSFKMRMELK